MHYALHVNYDCELDFMFEIQLKLSVCLLVMKTNNVNLEEFVEGGQRCIISLTFKHSVQIGKSSYLHYS